VLGPILLEGGVLYEACAKRRFVSSARQALVPTPAAMLTDDHQCQAQALPDGPLQELICQRRGRLKVVRPGVLVSRRRGPPAAVPLVWCGESEGPEWRDEPWSVRYWSVPLRGES